MASKVQVRLNSAGMRAMLQSPGVEADMGQRADRGAAAARGSAPVESGDYRDSIESWTVITDRAVGRFGASVPYAASVEANHGTLARALDAAG